MFISQRFNNPHSVKCELNFATEFDKYLADYHSFSKSLLADLKKNGKISTYSESFYGNLIHDASLHINGLLECYMLGYRTQTHTRFNKLMDHYKIVLSNKNHLFIIPVNTKFFRIRTDNNIINDRKILPLYTLFHIPFNKRYLVNNLRFNPHGIPCLYSANNLKTAWVESKRPIIDKSISKQNFLNTGIFLNSRELTCLDLSFSDFDKLFNDVYKFPKEPFKSKTNLNLLLRYLVLFPLISILHADVEYGSFENIKKFSIEYFIPTLLMDWLINQGLENYSYFNGNVISTIKYSSVEDFNGNTYNYALPSHYDGVNMYCKILESYFLKKFKYYYSDDIFSILGTEVTDDTTIAQLESYMISNI